MIHIDTLAKHIRNNIIKPAYNNYKRPDYDLQPAKMAIIEVLKTNENCHQIPERIEHYKLNLYQKNKLKLGIKNCDDMSFIICPSTGKIFMIY